MLQMSTILANGITLTAGHLVITSITFKYQDVNSVIVKVSYFADSKAYDDNRPEVLSIDHVCSGANYTTYFDPTVLNQIDKNPLDQAYSWIQTLPEYQSAVVV